MANIDRGVKYYLEFHKVQFYGLFCSTSSYDMFYFLKDFDIANYADDSTPFNVDKNIEFVVNNLQQSSSILFEWLSDNYKKIRTDKSHLLVYG